MVKARSPGRKKGLTKRDQAGSDPDTGAGAQGLLADAFHPRTLEVAKRAFLKNVRPISLCAGPFMGISAGSCRCLD
jgi:hypothetical protein